MSERITVGSLYPNRIGRTAAMRPEPPKQPAQGTGGTFEQLLKSQFIRFSHHAEERLKQRGIHFQPEQLSKISSAIDKAATKGARDSLMLMGDTALIVNIQSRTVVTAIDGDSMKDNVFTQIDSALVIS